MDAARLGEHEGERGGRAHEADGDQPRAQGGVRQDPGDHREASPPPAPPAAN